MARDPAHYWFGVILIYFGLHTVLRVVIGQPLTDLEAELAAYGAQFEWTYAKMLPLYPWLQHAAVTALGPGVLALALAKNLVLVVLTAAIYLTVRLTTSRGWAWLAMLSLLLLPQVAWSAHHDMSDDLLAAALAAVTVLTLTLLRRAPGLLTGPALGAVIGFGLLSAPSYGWFLAALLLASLSVSTYRRALLRPMTLIGCLAAMACVVAIPVYMSGQAILWPETIVLWERDGRLYAARYLNALFASAALLFCVVSAALVTGYSKAAGMEDAALELRTLFARTAAIGIMLLLAGTFTGVVRDVGQKEILPVLVLLAPAVALFLGPMISARDALRVTRVAGVLALVMLVASPIYHAWVTKSGQTAAVRTQPLFQDGSL